MGSAASAETPAPAAARERVLVVGATGRTGRRLVARLCADDRFEVAALVRDPAKARRVLGADFDRVHIVEGDLSDVPAWSHRLRGVRHCEWTTLVIPKKLPDEITLSLGEKEGR